MFNCAPPSYPPTSAGGTVAEEAPYSAETYAEKVDWVREAAGERFDVIELGALLLDVQVTDDPDPALERAVARFEELRRRGGGAPLPTIGELREAPMLAIGTAGLSLRGEW